MEPVLVEVTRGGVVESVHAVSLVVLGPDGTVVTTAGDPDRPVYGRSALKPAQTVAVLETLGIDLTDAEIALASGSHSGEPGHLEAVTALPARHGCGAPAFITTLADLARLPWRLAHAAEATTAGRVAAAMRSHPRLVAGTGRLDTVLMTEVPGALAKGGAEGVLVAALPDGSAFAAKVDDGQACPPGPVLADLPAAAGTPVGDRLAAVTTPSVVGGGRPVGGYRTRWPGVRTADSAALISRNVSVGRRRMDDHGVGF